MTGFRIGQGVDAHQLVAGRPLRLGGVEIPHDRGLEGHSDGDVLLHALASAILGAMGEGDLGTHFPSSDEKLKGIDSAEILKTVNAMLRDSGWGIGNIDATLVAQEPRLSSHLLPIRSNLSALLEVEESQINVKCTSTDHLGAIGRAEGIGATVVVLLSQS
jgi:2-C-methyl-D-erythritol 2,4-cyclodiphosphate synthase